MCRPTSGGKLSNSRRRGTPSKRRREEWARQFLFDALGRKTGLSIVRLTFSAWRSWDASGDVQGGLDGWHRDSGSRLIPDSRGVACADHGLPDVVAFPQSLAFLQEA